MEHIKEVWPVKAFSGALTLQAEAVSGEKSFLHSIDDPEQEAQDWLKQVKLTSGTAYIVYGFGLGYHVKALLDSLPQNSRIFVVEYSIEESLARVTQQLLPAGAKEWLKDKRIIYLASDVLRVISGHIAQHMRECLLGEIRVLRHYPTMKLFPEFYNFLEKNLVAEIVELLAFNVAFAIKHAPILMKNSWSNLEFIATGVGNAAFCDSFPKIPAIIVSSGPSLDKNIELLKGYKNQAVIIAAGTALRALAKRGITPHFVTVIDPFEPGFNQIRDYLSPEIILLSTYDANKHLVEEYPGVRVFCRATGADMLSGLSDCLPQASIFTRNGSVATVAFEFALYTGADPIVFVGQDLALSQGRSHAAGLSQAISYKTTLLDSDYLYVKSYDGQTVKTNNFLNDLRLYFSSRIQTVKNKKIINATEGGAYLDGAEHLPLIEVQKQYLTKTFKIAQIINSNTHVAVKSQPLNKRVKLLGEIQKIQETAKLFLNQINLFEQQINLKMPDCDKGRLISQYQDFFARLQNSSIYSYLKFYIDACYLMQALESRAEASLEKQLAGWEELFMKISQTLKILISGSNESLSRLEGPKIACFTIIVE